MPKKNEEKRWNWGQISIWLGALTLTPRLIVGIAKIEEAHLGAWEDLLLLVSTIGLAVLSTVGAAHIGHAVLVYKTHHRWLLAVIWVLILLSIAVLLTGVMVAEKIGPLEGGGGKDPLLPLWALALYYSLIFVLPEVAIAGSLYASAAAKYGELDVAQKEVREARAQLEAVVTATERRTTLGDLGSEILGFLEGETEPVPMGAIRAEVSGSKGGISKALARLIEAGHVEKSPAPEGSRANFHYGLPVQWEAAT